MLLYVLITEALEHLLALLGVQQLGLLLEDALGVEAALYQGVLYLLQLLQLALEPLLDLLLASEVLLLAYLSGEESLGQLVDFALLLLHQTLLVVLQSILDILDIESPKGLVSCCLGVAKR